MIKYLLQRVAAAALTLFIILTLAFCVVRLIPGSLYDNPDIDPDILIILEEQAHLNKPVSVQYYYFIRGIIFENDWGYSAKVEPGVPVFNVLSSRIPVSLELNLISFLIALPIGMTAGMTAALHRNKITDNVLSISVILGVSVPSFVFAALLQYVLAGRLGIFPILYEPSGDVFLRGQSMILPVIALSIAPIASITRYLRGELIENLDAEFMLLARNKGLSIKKAAYRHALRNAALPMINVIVPMFANILGGSMVVEKLFSVPGVGGILIKSVNSSDYSLTVAALVFYAAVSIAAVLTADISYVIIDPRIRLGGKKRHE